MRRFAKLTLHQCGKCHGTIADGTAIKALGKYWHRDHFTCGTCSKAFSGETDVVFFVSFLIFVLLDGKFFEIDGMPYCQEHYHAKRGTVCGKCSKVNPPVDVFCECDRLLNSVFAAD